jgi:hypothetical protein
LVDDDKSFTDILWILNDQVVSTSSTLVISITRPGDYPLRLSYCDLQDMEYKTQINVRVMEPESYSSMMAAVRAAVNLPLWLEDEELFLPLVLDSGRRDRLP